MNQEVRISTEIGSAGGGKTRTSWELTLTVGIPFSRWGASPFICSPVPFPRDIVDEITRGKKERTEVPERPPHPFELAQIWHRQLDSDPKLSKAGIAGREGISRARVTQIMDLLELPEEIRNGLTRPPASLKIHSFPERRLRILVRCGDEAAQMHGWQGLVQELVDLAGE